MQVQISAYKTNHMQRLCWKSFYFKWEYLKFQAYDVDMIIDSIFVFAGSLL